MDNDLKIISEIGSVHDGSYGNAMKLIEISSNCGADYVKFQTHIAESESLPDAPSPKYFNDESRLEYFKRTSFSKDQWIGLKEFSKKNNINFISSPFSLEAVDLLEDVGVNAYKIPSGEVTNIPLIEKIANTGKLVFLSSGMSNWDELDRAVNEIKNKNNLWIMQCSSMYPCSEEKVGLNVIREIRERYECNVGFSDHTMGIAASLGAVFNGATLIEKHITFSKFMYGSDAKHSMEINDFQNFCHELRSAKRIIDNPVNKNDLKPYSDMKKIFEKSIVAARKIKEGAIICLEDICYKKPGDGIPAYKYKDIVGLRAKKDINKNQKLDMKDLNR